MSREQLWHQINLPHVAGEGLVVAEGGDHLGVGKHLCERLEDKTGRGEVVFPENDLKINRKQCLSSPGLEPHVMGGVVSSDHDVVKIMLRPDLLQHLETPRNIKSLFYVI